MSALYPTEDTNHFPLTREIGLTTLAVGIIIGFPTAIAGATSILHSNFGEQEKKIVLEEPVFTVR